MKYATIVPPRNIIQKRLIFQKMLKIILPRKSKKSFTTVPPGETVLRDVVLDMIQLDEKLEFIKK